MNNDSKIVLLMMFQLQNGHRKLGEFTDIGTYPDCFISELGFEEGRPVLRRGYGWFYFKDCVCVCWHNTKIESISFPILDYISFEDKV